MISQTMTLLASNGLHTRIAAQLAMHAKAFSSTISLKTKDKQANMKSLFELQGLHLMKNTEIIIVAEGEDEKKALSTLTQFLLDLD